MATFKVPSHVSRSVLTVDTLLGVAAVALIFVIKKFLHTDGDDAPAGDGRP